ncbi:MAG: tRNA 4-thiouridine(8) synthase ThiI [Chloroflexi bacterium]|nr:tRNA 4-thiouridine(8) synthase ThiI [Chloroflexota bacterium]
MKKYVIAKFHETALKGKNRPMFIRRLVDNLRQSVKGVGVERVWQGHMRVGVTLSDESQWPLARERVKDCLGIAKFYLASAVEPNLDSVKGFLASELKGHKFDTFRITAHRTDKRFPKTSNEINRELGAFVLGLTNTKVNLSEPGLEIFVDVLPREILVYFDEVRGYGGLPVGVSGRTMALLSGGIDSPVAAWHMMKRGSRVSFVHFHSYPLVDTSSIEKATELAQMLARFQYTSKLFLAPLGEIQKHIILSAAPAYRVVLYRRFMVRIAEALARRDRAKALVTGESLAQVASQTLDNIALIDEVARMPILRPLIGANKDETIEAARRIGTYPVSILPDQDCCTLFVPRHPVTHGDPDVTRKLEELLPVEELVSDSLKNTEVKHFAFDGD